MRRPLLFAMILWTFAVPMARSADDAVLDETAYLRRYLCFQVARYSPAALEADGQKVLGQARLDKLRKDTELALTQEGIDPKTVNWMHHVRQPRHKNFTPDGMAPPPSDWADPEFDDTRWVCQRRPFQGSPPVDITRPNLGQFDETMDADLHAAYYRARFIVTDPRAAAALDLRLTYSGGARVLLNGREIARGHLPSGPLAPQTAADDYPAAAYKPEGEALRHRTLGPVKIDPGLLRQGTNVLAIEVRAADFNPVVQLNERQVNWGGPTRPFPHNRLIAMDLGPASPAAPSVLRRPAGAQVWAPDVNRRIESADFLPPGQAPGTVEIVAARNGTYAAQLVVGTDKPLAGLRVVPGPLKHADGKPELPASAVSVSAMAAYPADEWDLAHLGDERGLDARFPDLRTLSAHAGMTARRTWLFDQITPQWADSVPADTARPVWLSVGIPADAAPGLYHGAVTVRAEGMPDVTVPMNVEVIDWTLPNPQDFHTFVGCEENPYGVAAQYGVEPWSDAHFRLLAASFRQLGRVGNKWWNVPVIVRTEYGNKDDSMIRWVRSKDKTLVFDYALLDRYLDLAVKHCGQPRAINVVVMQGMKSPTKPPTPARVKVLDQATGKTALMDMNADSPGARQAWQAFAVSLLDHLKAHGLDRAVYWGHPLEAEADPELKNVLAAAAPTVGWTAGPHEMMSNGTFAKNDQYYKLITTIRYTRGWPGFRNDMGWKSPTPHLLNPRVGGTIFALHTTSQPFAYRVLPDHALALGNTGFTRVGADEWAAVHYDGMTISQWQTGIPILFVLWPGPNGAESSARYENLIEGIQETEARIFVEQLLDRGALPPALAQKAKLVLDQNLNETKFFLGNSMLHAFEEYPFGWQARARRVFALAAEASKYQRGK